MKRAATFTGAALAAATLVLAPSGGAASKAAPLDAHWLTLSARTDLFEVVSPVAEAGIHLNGGDLPRRHQLVLVRKRPRR